MKIAILLPYKENYSKIDAGAVSIFVNGLVNKSKFKKNITVYGSTLNKTLSTNYINLFFKKKFLQSSSKTYVKTFLDTIKNQSIDILEIHNRPQYLNYVKELRITKKILFFHNNPLEMQGSTTTEERMNILKMSDMVVFNSNWTKNKFLYKLNISPNHEKLHLIPQSTSKVNIDFSKKKKIISFVGKLNTSKGFDIFGNAIVEILNKHKEWKGLVIGNEPREKFFFKHKNLHFKGFKNNDYVLNKLKEVSISIVPSRWDEPFGRSSLEASSRGCAVIRSDTGGLNETSKFAVILKKLNSKELVKKIDYLINNKSYLLKLQKKSHKDFYLTHNYTSKILDNLRKKLISNNNLNKNCLKILHITNFNERFNARLHYNTGKRINYGLIRLGHNVYTLSDRDIISSNRSLLDPSSLKILNNKVLEISKNFKPDLILLGHADNIKTETLKFLKEKNQNLKISQWFLDPLSRKGPDYHKNKKRILDKINIIDSTFLTTDPKSVDFKINNAYFIPNPADKAFETINNTKLKLENDVFFAMSHGVHRGNLKLGKYDEREKILHELKKTKKIKFDFYGIENIQPIWGDDFLKSLSNSKMGLNLSRGRPIKYYSSDRIAQYMGNGLLTLIDEKVKYGDFFSSKEIVTYKDVEDLKKKILYYSKNDKKRKFIANNGRKKYLKEFNSEKVCNFIIEKTFNFKTNNKYLWYRNT